ncbi:MAG TPA: ABC transporter substrate-binding protein [Verrucomicrobiae bacterium]|jgi:NitT/TauT family transport system substrate-binding protein|nr:ABC transporter substrate-binding protein [Verrucomicrobiae bacterium]
MKFLLGCVVALVLALPEPSAAEKITILYSNATFTGTALFLTRDADLCRGRDIELELVLGGGSAPTVSAILGGYVQFIHVSASSVVNAALQRGPVAIVAKVMGPPPYKLVAAKSIRSIADLKGKKIGVNRFGGAPDFLLRHVLAKSGIDSQKEATILQTGDPTARLGALFSGGIDAVMLLVPEEKIAIEKDYPVIVDFAALNLPYVNIVFGANSKFLEEKPALVRNFLACYWEGVKRAKEEPELAKKALAHWTRASDSALLDYTYKSWRSGFAPASLKVGPEELDLILASAPKTGAKKEAAQFLDMRFLPPL